MSPRDEADSIAMRAALECARDAYSRGEVPVGAVLTDAGTLYVTLEPCAMCVGAMVHARVTRLVFAAPDPKSGACGSALDLTTSGAFNHRFEISRGVLQEESAALLKRFFAERR